MLIYMMMLETPEEKSLFEQIYLEYRGLMFHVAYEILHNEQDAEDAVHQAFVKIAENIKKIDTPVCPKTHSYVVTIVTPNISFHGTTANCSVFIVADKPTDDIDAVIKLWQGGQCIKTWEKSSTSYLVFSGEASVTKGRTYELTVDVSISGKELPRFSVEGTCS